MKLENEIIRFNCMKCGKCCQNLIKINVDGIASGLSLRNQELSLFPQENIVPHIRIGRSPDWSKPQIILRHQLNMNICPHIGTDNSCNIYGKRPLVCQSFPLIPVYPWNIVIADAISCSFVDKIEKNIGSLDGVIISKKNFKGFIELNKAEQILQSHWKKNGISKYPLEAKTLWFFYLNTMRWELNLAVS